MTQNEQTAVRSGNHWLCRMAEEIGFDLIEGINELDAWQWEPSEIALSLLEGAFPPDVHQGAKLHLTLWPWEKSRIVRAAYPNKVSDFARQAILEKAMTTELVPNPNSRFKR